MSRGVPGPAATPLVSVVMPSHNSEPTLAESIRSVLQQTLADLELIVVDDGSGDGSLRIAQRCANQDPRIVVVPQANAGASAARNTGIRRARGRLLAFLDADDTWDPQFLAALTGALVEAGEPAIAYCGWQHLGGPVQSTAPYLPPIYETADKIAQLLEVCPWPIHALVLPRSLVVEAGGFDEELRLSEDFDLWLRIAPSVPLVLVPRVLAYYNHHGQQSTVDHARVSLSRWQVQRRFLKRHPQIARQLGRECVRRLTHGRLLYHAFERYWARDLRGARMMFRVLMRHGYGTPRDWLYMLPSVLPAGLHAGLVRLLERRT